MSQQVIVVAIEIENANGFVVQVELPPGEDFKKLVEGAIAAGQNDEAIRTIGHDFFPLVHGLCDDEFGQTGVANFFFFQKFGDDTENLSTVFQHSIRKDTHEADVTSSVHEPDVAFGQHSTGEPGDVGMEWIETFGGAAKNADGVHVEWKDEFVCLGVYAC